MITIHKFTLQAVDVQEVAIPGCLEVLSVAEQHEDIVLYALVDTDVKASWRKTVHVIGTGHNASRVGNCAFLGTVNLMGGKLMFHVFVEREA